MQTKAKLFVFFCHKFVFIYPSVYFTEVKLSSEITKLLLVNTKNPINPCASIRLNPYRLSVFKNSFNT